MSSRKQPPHSTPATSDPDNSTVGKLTEPRQQTKPVEMDVSEIEKKMTVSDDDDDDIEEEEGEDERMKEHFDLHTSDRCCYFLENVYYLLNYFN